MGESMMVEHLRNVFEQAQSLSEEQQEALAARWEHELKDAAAIHTADATPTDTSASPAATIAPQYTPEQWAQARENLRARLREQGVVSDPALLPPHPGTEDLPPRGSPEEQRFLDELGDELSDALERSGLSILDLIERR